MAGKWQKWLTRRPQSYLWYFLPSREGNDYENILTSILHLAGDLVGLLLVDLYLWLRGSASLFGSGGLRNHLHLNIADDRVLENGDLDCLAREGKRGCLLVDVHDHLIIHVSKILYQLYGVVSIFSCRYTKISDRKFDRLIFAEFLDKRWLILNQYIGLTWAILHFSRESEASINAT